MRWTAIVIAALFLPSGSWAQDELADARSHLAAGRYQQAVEAWEKLLTARGREREVLMGLGKSLFGLREGKRSQRLFNEVAVADDGDGEARLWLGRVYERQGLEELEAEKPLAAGTLRDAARYYEQAADRLEDPFEARFAAGRVHLTVLDFEAALKQLRAATALRPDHEEARTHLLGALFRGERFEEFLKLARQRPDRLDRLREFEAILRLDRVAEAGRALEALIDRHGYSNRVEAYEVLRVTWARGARLEKAIELLKELHAARPDEFYALFYLGYAQGLAGRSAEAVKTLERYLERAPTDPTALRHLSSALRLAGDLTRAAAVIRGAIESHPSYGLVREEVDAVVGAFVVARRFEEALALHAALLAAAPGEAKYRRNHSILLKETGRLEEAADMLEALIAEDTAPGFEQSGYMNDLALCRKGSGDVDGAVEMLERAVETFSLNADAHENLGVIRYGLGRHQAAAESLETSLRVRGEGAPVATTWRARYYLGLIEIAGKRLSR